MQAEKIACRGAFFAGRCLLALGMASVFSLPAPAAERVTTSATKWHLKESTNFRVYSPFSREQAETLSLRCEELREHLAATWLGERPCVRWDEACDVVVHPHDASYLRAVGRGGMQTAGSALIETEGERVAARRIDLRAVRPGDREVESALAHELTHVVLADRIDRSQMPPWADEGMAVLADCPEKQAAHHRDLTSGLSRQHSFRTIELVKLQAYPAPHRQAVFYGQSASLVSFLVHRGSHEKFVEFLTIALRSGYDRALNQVYQIHGLAELEALWKRELQGSNVRFASYIPELIWQQSPSNVSNDG